MLEKEIFEVNMRQVGYMAAAGLYILDNNMLRLKNDHKKAKEIGKTLSRLSIVKIVESIETNIIQLEDDVDEQYFVK